MVGADNTSYGWSKNKHAVNFSHVRKFKGGLNNFKPLFYYITNFSASL
jgi:hypothetical protein